MEENKDYTYHTYIDNEGKQRTERIYTNEFLMNCKPSQELIDDLYESASLYLTFVVNMFKFTGHCNDTNEILKICTTDDRYMYKYTWTKEQRYEYEQQMKQIMRNCLGLTDDEITRELDVFNAFGGAFNLNDYTVSYDDFLKTMQNQ